MSSLTTQAKFPSKLAPLFEPKRYKVIYGGRGGGKSWGVARALLIRGVQEPLRIVCAREIQKSIADSVHKLLADQIEVLGLSDFYEVLKTEIRGANGTEFSFHGLKHNIDNIKSLEGADICWAEEAQAVSKGSWEKLIPTIRKPGSEIWITFNPELEDDYTYQRFVKQPPERSIVIKVNWNDNPWFSTELRHEKDELKARDPDAYLTVWEGHCRQTLDGAVYAKELRDAQSEGRITTVPYDRTKPVSTFWDLGRADKTAIWFAQIVGFEFRIIDYYENSGHSLAHYLEVLQGKRYLWGTDWLPHDAENELLGAERTIARQMRDLERNLRIVPKQSVADGINAARSIFNRCYFDADKCADGLMALRHYQYEVDPDDARERSVRPLHNWASHGADAFRYLALALKEPKPKAKEIKQPVFTGSAQGWMG